jgi:hypothetical protein
MIFAPHGLKATESYLPGADLRNTRQYGDCLRVRTIAIAFSYGKVFRSVINNLRQGACAEPGLQVHQIRFEGRVIAVSYPVATQTFAKRTQTL